jgi:predicted ATPase/class 3 adenylate cyclase
MLPGVREDLPRGTVTFLFTDVEGSTRLLHELGAEEYAAALAEHRRAIRDAFSAHGGVEVDTQGDAFFFAFPTAPGAVEAARVATSALDEGPIRVRVGVHTGTPVLAEEGYVGADVHRAARIAAAGHGGQVLISSSTAGLVGVTGLRDLGEHRFKDLAAPERVYQLGDGEFPPLKSLYRTNLPVPTTPFLGRERELAEVVELVQQDGLRVVTLTGPGGTGKTRLALQAAAETSESFPDGTWWVPLAPLRDASAVIPQIAQALGATVALPEHIADKRMLVLLDNLEHLLSAVPAIAGLLSACPNLVVLATSRELLQLQGERAYPVPTLSDADGAHLFVARALAVAGDVSDEAVVGEICRRLDNLPLAVELAAARMRHLTPEGLLERVSKRLDLLKAGRDADPRQQTLRATIEWSYELLDASERRLFARFSVFAAGSTFEAAETVCDADLETLGSLVDKSLIRRTGDRFWMLETIREFAAERLDDSGEADAVRRRHAEYFVALGRSAGLAADNPLPQRHLLILPERDNVRVGLAWAFEHGEYELGMRLVVELENFWAVSTPHEGGEWAAKFLEAAGDQAPAELRARALRVQGGMNNIGGYIERAVELWSQSLEIHRSLGDERGVAIILHRLATPAAATGDWRRARELAEESLAGFHRVGWRKGEPQALSVLADCARAEGDLERARELLEEAAAISKEVGFPWWQAGVLAKIAAVSLELGRAADATPAAQRALSLSSAMQDTRGVVYELALLAEIAAAAGDRVRAGRLWGAMEAEIERAPVGRWLHGNVEPERVLRHADEEFERGREEGRRLDLDEAVAAALDDA